MEYDGLLSEFETTELALATDDDLLLELQYQSQLLEQIQGMIYLFLVISALICVSKFIYHLLSQFIRR